jgi:hypothetical protein
MYLGDGYVCRMARTYRLEVYLNRKDERGIGRVGRAIRAVLPGTRVGLRGHGTAVVVTSYWKQWPLLFPQHGIGRKNLRRICLRLWQRRIVGQYAEDFIRGCIDSDGCRHRRVVKRRNYPAYSFRNHSDDIITLFSQACQLAGVGYTRATRVTISIARRAEVARMDTIMNAEIDRP